MRHDNDRTASAECGEVFHDSFFVSGIEGVGRFVKEYETGIFIDCAGDEYALFIGKVGSYIEFPAIEGVKLVSVEIVCGTNMANANKLNIADAAGATYSTDFVSSNETKGTTHKFDCTGTAVNTAYRLVMLADKNLQINGWKLTYSE